MDSIEYKEVGSVDYDRFPGDKIQKNEDGKTSFAIAADQTRPISDRARRLADLFIESLREEGLLEEMAKGGMPLAGMTRDLASAIVAVQDECSPQYARAAVTTLSAGVEFFAHVASNWAVGADRSIDTLVERRERNTDVAAPKP